MTDDRVEDRGRSAARRGSRPRAAGATQRRRSAVTAEQAVQAIQPGDHVFVGSACATPRTLLRALEARSPPPEGVQLIHFLTDGATVELDGRAWSAFRHRAFYLGRDMCALAASGRVDYVPISLAEVPRLLESGRLACDVALVQASPPGRGGRCSLGVSVDVTGRPCSARRP